MMRRTTLIAVFAAAVAACTSGTPEQQIVNDTADALGERERIRAVNTLSLEGEATSYNLGQDVRWEATSQTFVGPYVRTIDVPAGRARTEHTRTPTFTYFRGQEPAKQVQGIDGNVAYNIAANGTATRVPDLTARERRAEIYHHPVTIVQAALAEGTQLANPRTVENESVVEVTTADGFKFTLATDATTKLPTRVVSMAYHPNMGDVAIETSFTDYQDVNGLKLPARLTTKTDRHTTAEVRVTQQAVDVNVSDLAAPAAAASAPPITAPAPATVTVEEVTKGVWWLAGQGAHSVLVEFSDHLMLIEVPQNETRTLAVIAKARELRPEKPLTQAVLTHHHFDHTGGLRAAVSEGLTVIAHKLSEPYVKEIVERSHTIVADALARNPKPLNIETVDDERVFKDGAMTVILYHVAGSIHADTQLMAYLPRERILVEGDDFSPGDGFYPYYAPALLANVEKRKLRVDRIVPVHGNIAPYSELVKTVRAMRGAEGSND